MFKRFLTYAICTNNPELQESIDEILTDSGDTSWVGTATTANTQDAINDHLHYVKWQLKNPDGDVIEDHTKAEGRTMPDQLAPEYFVTITFSIPPITQDLLDEYGGTMDDILSRDATTKNILELMNRELGHEAENIVVVVDESREQ